ncbi:MAG: NAD(P)H-dependent oxidoreductase [Usitatibacter sp.]
MILVIHAHPYPGHSRGGAAMLSAIREVPGVEVRALYALYPDFDIDVAAEQRALEGADTVVLLHPLYWYSVPALLKHWFDHVLLRGWAWGDGDGALKGKRCLWAVSTGGDEQAFSPEGRHKFPIGHYQPVVEQTMRFCGMEWLEPFVLHAPSEISASQLATLASGLRQRLEGGGA